MKPAGTYRITRQGQITLPSQAREELDLREGDVVDMFYGSDIVVIKKKKEPIKIFEELSEKVSNRFKEKKLSRLKIQKEIEVVRSGRIE